jgi:AcrR family transcriptional regulator
LYRLFANKDDLMDHLIARGYDGVRGRYDAIEKRKDLEPLKILTEILNAYCDYALNHPNHYQMWFETGVFSLEAGQLKMRHGSLEFVVFRPWLESIEACREIGLFPGRDRFEVFQILWARVHGLISLRLHHPDFPWLPAEEHLAEVLDLDGLARV